MQIREATINDAPGIENVYLHAFDQSESGKVSGLAVNLLDDRQPIKTVSLVALEHDQIVGHIAFSPVFIAGTGQHIGYILAPLAVSPDYQNINIGSSLINYGLETISDTGAFMIFVYGDPRYYSRFEFKAELARDYIPPHPLRFPEGWLALKLDAPDVPDGGNIMCLDALDDPELW